VTDEGRLHDDPEASGRLLFVFALLLGALLRLVLLGAPDLFGSDEGTWAVGARNLSEDGLKQAIALGRTPLGPPAGVPVLFPWMLSVMVRVFGPFEWCLRLPSALFGLLGAFVLERIVRRGYGQPAGHLAGAFAALFPPLVAGSRASTVEPTLAALGLSGIIFALRAFEEDIVWEGAAAGVLFGLGFLAKGYAVGLFMVPLLAALVARPSRLSLGRTRRSLGALGLAFLLVGGSHLLATAVLAPAAFVSELATDFGASALAAETAMQPTAFGADLKTIVKTLFLFLPLVGLGVAFLSRPVGEPEVASGATGGERRLSHEALWAAYGLELLVVVAIAGRVRLSSLTVMPALAAFAGLGGAALLQPSRESTRRRREVVAVLLAGVLVIGTALVLMAAPDDPLFGGRRSPVSAAGAIASIALSAVGAALFAAGLLRRRLNGRLGPAFLSVLLLAGALESLVWIRRDLLGHRTFARELADQLAPQVAGVPPTALAFRAPDPEAVEFHLFRTGASWASVSDAARLARDAEAGVRFWAFRRGSAVGAEAPPPDAVRWLEANAREVTGDLDARAGRATGLRVFVPRTRS
jgi:4-amino-4-deoxy-L-arabinose transferase-like glycosyltransferase